MLPPFLQSLSKALNEAIDASSVLSIEETDQLARLFREGYQRSRSGAAVNFRRSFPAESEAIVVDLANCLADQIPAEELLVLIQVDGDQVALTVKAGLILKHSREVIGLDGNSVCLVSLDRKEGLLVDFNSDDPGQAFEFAAWGNRWPLIVLGCAHSV